MFKNYLKSIIWFLTIIIISSILITIFHYFSIFNTKTIKIMKITLIILTMLISSFILGKKCTKKGYLEGLKFGAIIILILTLLNLILHSLSLKSIIFFSILLISSMLGSMIGINKSKRN